MFISCGNRNKCSRVKRSCWISCRQMCIWPACIFLSCDIVWPVRWVFLQRPAGQHHSKSLPLSVVADGKQLTAIILSLQSRQGCCCVSNDVGHKRETGNERKRGCFLRDKTHLCVRGMCIFRLIYSSYTCSAIYLTGAKVFFLRQNWGISFLCWPSVRYLSASDTWWFSSEARRDKENLNSEEGDPCGQQSWANGFDWLQGALLN